MRNPGIAINQPLATTAPYTALLLLFLYAHTACLTSGTWAATRHNACDTPVEAAESFFRPIAVMTRETKVMSQA
jgi:hypothetical protein